MKIGLPAKSAPWNNRVISVVHQVSQACCAGAAVDGWNFGGTQTQFGAEVPHVIADAHFAEPAESVSEVRADIRAIKPIVSSRIILRINLKRRIASAGVRRNEPLALCTERPIELTGHSIGIPEQEIRAPFGAESGYIGERQTRAQRELNVSRFGAIDFKGGVEGRWREIFLLYDDQQTLLSIAFHDAVIQRVVPPASG